MSRGFPGLWLCPWGAQCHPSWDSHLLHPGFLSPSLGNRKFTYRNGLVVRPQ